MPVRLLLVEYNEITPSLLQRFMSAGELPHFRRFFEASTAYTTHAGDAPLEPWIQWPSIHCGVPYEEHGVRYLGDGRRIAHPGIATVLSDAGVRVGIFGTINTNYQRLNGYHVPDPWSSRALVEPRALQPFYDFVAKNVQENTKDGGTTLRDAARFMWFMVRHGLHPSTMRRIVLQLVGEIAAPGTKWKRAAMLDLLQYDAFRSLNHRMNIEFASFFSNSTAHLQHYYWRNMDPTGFEADISPTDHPSTRDAVRFGYRAMDALLGRMVADNPGALLVLCSGLSQQPWYETTKCTYRPHDFGALLRFAGVIGGTVMPVMAERFRVEFASAVEARQAASALATLTSGGAPIMGVDHDGTTMYAGCDLYDPGDDIFDRTVSGAEGSVRFGSLFYRITTMNSGRHHPEGIFWLRNGRHRVVDERLPITAIAPILLEHLGVQPPPSMRDRFDLRQSA